MIQRMMPLCLRWSNCSRGVKFSSWISSFSLSFCFYQIFHHFLTCSIFLQNLLIFKIFDNKNGIKTWQLAIPTSFIMRAFKLKLLNFEESFLSFSNWYEGLNIKPYFAHAQRPISKQGIVYANLFSQF